MKAPRSWSSRVRPHIPRVRRASCSTQQRQSWTPAIATAARLHAVKDSPWHWIERSNRLDRRRPIGAVFAGFNGENFDAKLWGVARLRHNDLFAADAVIEHPADKYGDAGAATGAILTALAAKALATGARKGPALVWAASDREPRACALLSLASG